MMTITKKTFITSTLLFILTTCLLVISLTGCVTINTPSDGNNQTSQQNNQGNTQPGQQGQQGNTNSANPAGEQKAKSIAIADAGFSEGQVNVTKCHLDYDDGIQKYEIEFVNGTNKYEYDIKADDFRILKKEIDSIYD